MGYFYENLDEDQFQRLAQAILTTVFPNVQCLPVKQPDGGRDAFNQYIGGSKGEFHVYQVKFSRTPNAKTERDAIEALIEGEQEKVEKLKQRGATAYYLISNVAGTAHLDTGSIDKVNVALTEAFGIPSYCWWRDDLDSRIDAHADIKWSFPDIMRATDILPILLQGVWTSTSREQALKSYLAIQYLHEEEVKFKQVELQNKLLELFVDLPIAPLGEVENQRLYWTRRVHSGHLVSPDFVEFTEEDYGFEFSGLDNTYIHPNGFISAASILLEPTERRNCMVLEGAPGQGKSTITQYICQVNRIKLLGKDVEKGLLNKKHLSYPVRFPFRIDLRDYASWVSGKNPFNLDASLVTPNGSLESFISAQVTYLSGGHEFSVADFVAFVKSGHISIILDGFDEVADIATRKKVVDEISRSATRLQTHQKNIQFIVTSRPAAFANSPGFSYDTWAHFELQAMIPAQIREYSQKWMAARRLPPKEKDEFSRLLSEKLEQPHMRDLARNPMQLTILLALIHTRGLSLPDKRTALYDNYMELFFNREAEKSRVVREHRDLLIDLHRHIAWKLHTDAEDGKSDGSISDADLRVMLSNYLRAEGHDSGLVDKLFIGMIERVVALVARKQGAYEFEVQPLREYFAARHLYETAPYSPPGTEVGGTKPDRFDALARNFYWLNVTRFYCGCYSRGELSSLADGLELLAHDEAQRYIPHPRTLSFMLLGDWVFSQQPLLVKRIILQIFDDPGFKILISGASRGRSTSLLLPEKCGRSELAVNAYLMLEKSTSLEDRLSILEIVRLNTSEIERVGKWIAEFPSDFELINGWISDGVGLGVLACVKTKELEPILKNYSEILIPALIEQDRFDIIYHDERSLKLACQHILSSPTMVTMRPLNGQHDPDVAYLRLLLSPLSFYKALSSKSLTSVVGNSFNTPALRALKNRPRTDKFPSYPSIGLDNVIVEALDALTGVKSPWSTSLEPWRHYMGIFYKAFGGHWNQNVIAVIAAGIRSSDEIGAWSVEGWSSDGDLCGRIRFARLKSGNISWWSNELDALPSDRQERNLLLLTLFVWASTKTIIGLATELSQILDTVETQEWSDMLLTFRQLHFLTERVKASMGRGEKLPAESVSPRVLVILFARAHSSYQSAIYKKFLASYGGEDKSVLNIMASAALVEAVEERVSWDDALSRIAFAYANDVIPRDLPTVHYSGNPEACEKICREANLYPQFLVRWAHETLTVRAGNEAMKLKAVSQKEEWFKTNS